MGLLDKIKKMFSRSKTKKLGEGQKVPVYRLPEVDISDTESCDFYSVEYYQGFTHRDGRDSNLMVTCINIGGKDWTRSMNDNVYVAFEMPNGEMLNEVYSQKIVECYLKEKQNPQNANKECIYIGEINGNPQDKSVKKSGAVENYVNNEVASQIRNFKQDREEARQQYQKEVNEMAKRRKEEFDERLRAYSEQNRREDQQMRTQRKQNPYLKQEGKEYKGMDGKTYIEYNGININNGDILKIRELNKVGKDETGRYLYTGYIQSTAHEEDVEGKSLMVPVCFATDKGINDMVQENNPVEIRNLLNLFSKEENFRENNGYMNYIGTFDKNGRVTKGEDNSQRMSDAINHLKEEARVQYVQKRSQARGGQDWTH